MKRFFSFSGGVESSTLAVLFGNVSDGIFADTGYEHDKLYERLELVEKTIRQFHENDFKIIRVKNKDWENLPAYIKHSKYYPSFNQRFCTRMFKIEPIDDYLKQFDEVELMVGLNADEVNERTGNHGNIPTVKYTYPLIDAGITRNQCEQILNTVGLHPQFPAYMMRGGCKGCYYKSKKEYIAMAHLSPSELDEVIDIEQVIQDERKEFYGIRDGIPSMRKLKEKALATGLLFDASEVFPVINTATKCGVFCNR